MSEYIVDWDDSLVIDTFSKNSLREEIVRCRDCGHAYKDVCERPIWDDGERACTPIEPDGFCAWGERRG